MRTKMFACLFGLLGTTQAITAQESIPVGSTTRNMITYAPTNLPYNPPLVISLHGMGQDAAYQRNQAKWESVADTAKFVVVYPNGEGNAWDISGDKDIRFLEAIIDTMYNRYHVNRNRVYLSGFSMGGMMTYHAMAKMGNKIAAFGPVSGIPVDYRNPSGTRAVPIIHTHGTGDNVVYYEGDPNHAAGGYGSIPDYIKKWAKFDGCDMTPTVVKPYPSNKPGSAATLTRYSGGKDGVEVVLISIEGKGHWHSNDPVSVITTEEIWNFCKRYSLGPEEPEPPHVVSADPEDTSFDLKADGLSFVYTLSEPVYCEKVTATLSQGKTVWPLVLSETGLSETLTFGLPQDAQPADGDYILTLTGLENEAGGVLKPVSFHYTFGITEVGDEPAVETVLRPDWKAEESKVGEGIPTGWKRVNSRADGTKDEKESGAAHTGGARLKYFPDGGDFNTGFYLSARDYDVCHLTYGEYEDYRLHLLPGKYVLTFNSVYWSAGAMDGKATFGVQLSDGGNVKLLSKTGLPSSNTMNEATTEKVTGSYAHEYGFTVTEEGDYVLDFNMSEGWNSVILGNVKIATQPTTADVYKGGFVRMLKAAQELFDATAGEAYTEFESLRTDLKAVIDEYAGFVSTSPTAYAAATSRIEAAMKPLGNVITGVSGVIRSDVPIRVERFGPDGRPVGNACRGLVIIREYYGNGQVVTRKVIMSI